MKLVSNLVRSSLILLVSGLFMGEASIAKTTTSIQCPAIDKIHGAAPLMTQAQYTGVSILEVDTVGDAFVDSDLTWMLTSKNILASSKEEAVTIAQSRATKVTQPLYEEAAEVNNSYSCYYYDASLQNPFISIMAMGVKK